MILGVFLMLFQVLFLVYTVLDFRDYYRGLVTGIYRRPGWASVIIKKLKKKIIKIQGSMIIVLATWLEISLARPTF